MRHDKAQPTIFTLYDVAKPLFVFSFYLNKKVLSLNSKRKEFLTFIKDFGTSTLFHGNPQGFSQENPMVIASKISDKHFEILSQGYFPKQINSIIHRNGFSKFSMAVEPTIKHTKQINKESIAC